jgi:hypothetical protein
MSAEDRKRSEIIERWMLASIRDGGIRRFDDLHIDEVEPAWKDRKEWIEGALEAFRMAMAIRDGNQLPFVVGLVFSLQSGDQPLGVDFHGPDDISERLDWSPPSLYLFHRGEEPDTQSTNGAVKYLDPAIIGAEGEIRCYHLEFKQEGADVHSRSVFIDG